MKLRLKKTLPYCAAGIFMLLLCSLGITFALGANQMEVVGQAWFTSQTTSHPDRLPMFPVDNGGGNYFTPNATGSSTVHIIEQLYEDGDFYLSICSSNSNSGNQNWSMIFSFLNPTIYTWSSGSANVATWPLAQGGLNNNGFAFQSANVQPATLTTNQIATVTLNMRSQLGSASTQGAAIVTVSYRVNGQTRDSRVYFKYYSRNSAECPL